MSRRAVAILVGAVVATAGALGVVALGGGDEPGRVAPGFSLPSVRDPSDTVALADFAGRPVVLNFWASWCVPCKKEMPALQRVSEAAEGEVAFVGIDHQDGRGGAIELLEETGVDYPSGFDPGGEVAQRYRVFGMPSTFFIDAEGRILAEHTGELTEDDLVERIDSLFGVDVRPNLTK